MRQRGRAREQKGHLEAGVWSRHLRLKGCCVPSSVCLPCVLHVSCHHKHSHSAAQQVLLA